MSYQNALITGASSGLGAGLAHRFAQKGTRVFALARREDKLAELREASGEKIEPVVLDVSDTDALVAKIRELDAACGGLDLIIANAGVGKTKKASRIDWENWVEPTLRVNVLGAIATLTAVLPRMVEERRGHLVGVSSIAAIRGLPGSGAYSASKAALSTYLETLRVDLKSKGITVTTLEPGFVKTPLTEGGKQPMPFLMELEPALDAMMNAIEKKKGHLAFPWTLASAAGMGRMIPRSLYSLLVGR
ncbi:MAG: SDR family NAD(P)-dependent oxidoreductase [Deltaproteobacteria bacterium]|nr:SDR family NAD(P)-dependent oxidoreductase [Deltaproteobacteria bacterium]